MKPKTQLLALFLLFVLSVWGGVFVPAYAQDDGARVSGLDHPRGMAFDAEGNLYIATAGMDGTDIVVEQGPFGAPTTTGNNSRLLKVAPDGTQTVVLDNLSNFSLGVGDPVGVQRVLVTGDSLWILLAEGAPSVPFTTALIELDLATNRIKTFIDLYSFEAANNPDGAEGVYSNPSDFAVAPDGTLFIVDTGANAILTWTAEAGLAVFKAWQDDPVPTAIDFAPNGNFFISFLTPFPFTAGAARIEEWTPAGELVNTYTGMTMLTDVLVTEDGAIYAVSISRGLEGMGFAPESGMVLSVNADGSVTPVMEGLNFPYALTETPDGGLLVSVNSAYSPAGAGMVLDVPVMME